MSQGVALTEEETGKGISGEMGRWVERVLGPQYHHFISGKAWKPAINFYEDDSQYLMIVDLAGAQIEQIDLRIDGGVLTLSGQREAPGLPESSGRKRVHLMEIDHGKFSREMQLPQDVVMDAIEASYRGGYLWVRLPKKA